MRHFRWVCFVTGLLMSANAGCEADEARYDFSHGISFRLSHGLNDFPDFDGAGHPAQVIFAWRENMNAHGYGIYLVLMPRPGTRSDWNVVTFETHESNAKSGDEVDELYDEPFDEEEAVASVRFVKALWRGEPATLAITARRDLSDAESFIDPAPVEFAIYKLVANKEGIVGWPFYYFDRIEHFTSDKRYCNSDLALSKELHVPLPKGYRGLHNDDGCIR